MYMVFFHPVVIVLALVAIAFIYGIATMFDKED